MPQDRIHLVLSCDDNFAQHAGVLMQSLLRTAAHPNRLVFHLIDGGIQPDNLQKIQAIVSNWSAQLDLLHIDQQRFSHLFYLTNIRWPRITGSSSANCFLPKSAVASILTATWWRSRTLKSSGKRICKADLSALSSITD